MKWTKTYSIWCNVMYRTRGKRAIQYHDYGGRGITVCERWHKFENFLADMGECPSDKYSIDRIDHDGNYEPANCRWADKWEQAANKRNNRRFTIGGETLHMAEWCRRTGVPRSKIHGRLKLGWTPEEAFEFVPRQRPPVISKNR